VLELRHVDTFYGRSQVLRDVTLSIPSGEIVTVLGRNGVGKTTLLKCIMGLTDHTAGEILFDGTDIAALPTHERARAGVGYVPQGREIIAEFTVRNNILMGCYARPDGKRAIPPLVLEMFPYIRDNLGRPGGLLSGGQQQQLAIARALASAPKILLLDEPTEGIQPNIVELIQATIARLNRELGLTIVLVEQNVAFARAASRHFVIIETGMVAAQGPISALTDEVVHRHMTV
jgi:urea transport system ATP-binding protein